VVTLQHQPAQARYVNHLLYASPVKRGDGVEVIEDIIPLHDVEVALNLPEAAKRVYLAPQGTELPFRQNETTIAYTVPRLECHQMVVIET
ncbi:beta-galactosidase, partial [Paenibacillus sepulcri]|nr:beta-galactosidase [Paenibacillus sepulcri]